MYERSLCKVVESDGAVIRCIPVCMVGVFVVS